MQPVSDQSQSGDAPRAAVFRYDDFVVDAAENRVTCRYRLDEWVFSEEITVPGGGDWASPAAYEAARWVFLLAGVSYYKAGAPPVIDLGDHAVTDVERSFLREFYVDGLGEFAYRSTPRLNLSGLEIHGPRLERPGPVGFSPSDSGPLVPFGGGVDSIVTVEMLRPATSSPSLFPSLFVVNRPGDRFEAIEQPASVTGLPVVRAERVLDPQVLRSAELGFLNGHVPVTGVISAIAVLAAVVGGHDAVVMSNEWSASMGNVDVGGRMVNHQYSKSLAFEAGFRRVIAESIGPDLQYFSMLRPYSELWIAQRFSALPQFFDTFRSCNRAFTVDPARRLDHWCGVCDKCCFIDLILAPFVDADVLRQVFDRAGFEPLDNPDLAAKFDTLLGLTPDTKPWECVGDVDECRVAARMALARPDRHGSPQLTELTQRLPSDDDTGGNQESDDRHEIEVRRLLAPIGEHFVPERYQPDALAH